MNDFFDGFFDEFFDTFFSYTVGASVQVDGNSFAITELTTTWAW